MAKNKKQAFDSKNVKINKEELSITKIGEIRDAEQSPWMVIGIFLFLLVFIFFLPSLVNLIKGDSTRTDPSSPVITEPEDKDQEPSKVEEKYFEIENELKIPLEEKLVINNFSLEQNKIKFMITNNGETRFNFNRKNYFLELYTEEDTLLERVILEKASIGKEESIEFSYELAETTTANAKKIRFVEKEIDDYPNIELQKNEANEELLVCTKDTETITYKFQNGKLQNITDVINETYSDDLSYSEKLESWKTKSASYNNVGGISSTFIDTGVGFFVNTVLDLANVKITNVDNENYYTQETLAKVVKFEMDSRGFTCK